MLKQLPSFAEFFQRSPLGQEMVKEAEQSVRQRRAAAFAEIAKLEAEHAKTLPALDKAFTAADAKYKAAVDALTVAMHARDAALGARNTAGHRHDRAVSIQQEVLRGLAPLEPIQELEDRLNAELRRLRNDVTEVQTDGISIRTGEPVVRTNHAARTARITAVLRAIQDCRQMHLTVQDFDQFEDEAEKLFEHLPSEHLFA